MDFRYAKIANPRLSGKPAAQYIVPRDPQYTQSICPSPTPGVCVYSESRYPNSTANRAAAEWIDFWSYPSASYWSSKEQAENYWVDTVIDNRYYPNLLLQLFYDGNPPVWPLPFQPLGGILGYRYDQYTPSEISNWFS